MTVAGEGEFPAPATRLDHPSQQVRRIAILDLASQRGDAASAALAALLSHLPRERDERTAILIVRRLGEALYSPAQPVLAALRDSPTTPIRLYHAALLAHDRIERSGGAGPCLSAAPPAKP